MGDFHNYSPACPLKMSSWKNLIKYLYESIPKILDDFLKKYFRRVFEIMSGYILDKQSDVVWESIKRISADFFAKKTLKESLEGNSGIIE